MIPDLPYAVASPVRITDDCAVARCVFDVLSDVPTLVWGRDDVDTLAQPAHARAPGSDMGWRGRTRRQTRSGGSLTRPFSQTGVGASHRIASAHAGEPMAPGIHSGAEVNKKSHCCAYAAAGARPPK